MQEDEVKHLESIALRIREDILQMVHKAGEGHAPSALSTVEILVTLYFHILKHNPLKPSFPERDRLVLSKGHGCAALYAVLARSGYFPPELLDTFLGFDTNLPGHPDMRRLPGLDMSTGSLGHGLPVGVGMALAAGMECRPYRVFVILGDGEQNEGSIWEAAMVASHYRLENLVAIVDRNGMQVDGPTRGVLDTEPMGDKWRSFGWAVLDVDGHSIQDLSTVLEQVPHMSQRPTLVLARTVKGKGVSFMEADSVAWHYRGLSGEELRQALEELVPDRR